MKKETELDYGKLALFFATLIMTVFIITATQTNQQPTIQDYNVDNIDLLIDKIANDCGSTHITKKYGSDNWSVFIITEKNGWTKSEYVELHTCLEVQDDW